MTDALRAKECPACGPYYDKDGITIYQGDCRDVLPRLEKVDHVITDPPFDSVVHSRGGHVKRYDGGPDIATLPFAPLTNVGHIAAEIARLSKRWSLVFCAVRQIEQWASAFEANGINVPRVMVWVKPDASPQFSGDRPGHGFEPILLAHPVGKTRWNGGGHKGVFVENRIDHESGFLHPTQKPLNLLRRLVQLFTDPGDLVLDPFAGSLTTAVACKELGRRCIAVEMDEGYVKAGIKRLEATAYTPPLFTMPTEKPVQESML